MKMTKIGMMAAVCGLIAAGMGTTAQAQVARGKRGALGGKATKLGEGKRQGKMAQLLQQLNLTPDQKKQIVSIEATTKKQAMTIRQNASLSAADKKTQEKELGKETRKQIVGVLTPDQKKQLKQLLAAQRQQAGKGAVAAPSAPGTPTPVSPPAATSPKTGAATPGGAGSSVASSPKSEEDDELDGLDELA